jgi:hypothetical protein
MIWYSAEWRDVLKDQLGRGMSFPVLDHFHRLFSQGTETLTNLSVKTAFRHRVDTLTQDVPIAKSTDANTIGNRHQQKNNIFNLLKPSGNFTYHQV